MLLANYASDSDSGSDTESAPAPAPAPGPSRPAPVAKKRKGPVKIGLDLPKASSATEEEAVEEDRSFKKPRAAGAGSSSLLGMLPAPKRKLPTATAKPSLSVNKAMAAKPSLPASAPAADSDDSDDKPALMLPASMARKAVKKPAADLDLFGLAEAAPKPVPVAAPKLKPPTVSAAPAVADFVPPEPTATDPYPGYYQLPSGSWAAYDPVYYASFFDDGSAAEATKKDNRVGQGHSWAELDDGRANVVDFDVSAGLEEGRKERERMAVAAATKPKYADEFEYKELGQTKGLAAERHQLTSLLSSAYSQREELEARIAQNKKNMRAAGTKYGF